MLELKNQSDMAIETDHIGNFEPKKHELILVRRNSGKSSRLFSWMFELKKGKRVSHTAVKTCYTMLNKTNVKL